MLSRVDLVADVLMAAAYADDELDGRELEEVERLLTRALREDELPEDLAEQINEFDPDAFDLDATISELLEEAEDELDKRNLLDLIASVHEADDTWDFAEDDFLRDVATKLGMEESEYADLVLNVVEVEEVGKKLLPPPLPKK